jgi:hypothetical protein
MRIVDPCRRKISPGSQITIRLMTTLHCGDANCPDVNFLEQFRNWNHGIFGRVHGSLLVIVGQKVVWTQTTLNNSCNHVLNNIKSPHHSRSSHHAPSILHSCLSPPTPLHFIYIHVFHLHASCFPIGCPSPCLSVHN